MRENEEIGVGGGWEYVDEDRVLRVGVDEGMEVVGGMLG